MKNKGLVSILMNCYNSDLYLTEAIDSVINQSYIEWEIIFWDNQSTDDSAEIVKLYNDKRIKYYYATKHTSLYEARNCALKHCRGEYLAFLDCDDLWTPDKLFKQVKVLKNDDDVVLVHSNTIFFDTEKNIQKIANKKNKKSGYIFQKNILKYQFSLETVLVKMAVIQNNSIDFDNRFNMIGDRDFLSTTCFYGKVEYIDEILGKWRIHPNNFSKALGSGHPKELKIMYLRFKQRFGPHFTRKMRIGIYNEIVLRESLNLFKINKVKAREHLRGIYFFNAKSLFLRVLSYMPSKFIAMVLQPLTRV